MHFIFAISLLLSKEAVADLHLRGKSHPPTNATVSNDTGPNTTYPSEDETPKGARLRMGTSRLRQQYTRSILFSADGKMLISDGGAFDPTIRFRDVATGKELRHFVTGLDEVVALALAPNGQWLASAYQHSAVVSIWDTASGKELRRMRHQEDASVSSLAFSPVGPHLVSGAFGDNAARLWNVRTGQLLRQFPGHKDGVEAVAISPQGDLLATADSAHFTRIWEIKSGKVLHCFADDERIEALAFAPSGKHLAARSHEGSVCFWDVVGGTKVRGMGGSRLSGASDIENMRSSGLAFSPDGKVIAAAGGPETPEIQLYDTSTGKRTRTFRGLDFFTCLAFSPDGKTLAAAGYDRRIRLWDVVKGQELLQYPGHDDVILSADFSPDGKLLATAGFDGRVILWDVTIGKPIRYLGHQNGPVHFVVFSPTGALVACGGPGGKIHLWDPVSGQERGHWPAHRRTVYGALFSPDGKTLASFADDQKVKLWSMPTGKGLREFVCTGMSRWMGAFAGDFSKFASCDEKHRISLWDLSTGKLLRKLGPAAIHVGSIELSPNGELVAGGAGWGIQVWNAVSGKTISVTGEMERSLCSFAFCPDNAHLISCSSDLGIRTGKVQIWDAHTARECYRFEGKQPVMTVFAFSPASGLLATSGEDTTITLFDYRKLIPKR
jgi:WD40 repeat protein